jgi:outer membrane protein TolC
MSPKRRLYYTALAIIALIAAPAVAQETLELSLQQAIDIAMENNLSLHTARLDTQIQTSQIAAEKARFGRNLTGGIFHQSERAPSISALEQVQNTTSNSQALTFGLSQELLSGGRLGLELSNSRSSSNVAFRTIDPVYSSSLNLNFTQPLMRGRGAVNQTDLELARNDLEGSCIGLEDRTRSLRAEVGLAYWNLFLARANLETRRQLHAGAQRVLETVRARAEMGTGTRNSILQAEVGVAQRQEEIVVAEGIAGTAEDQLKASCALDRDPAAWGLQLLLSDRPAVAPFNANLQAGILHARDASAAYRQNQLLLKNMDLQIALARDRTRPDVALSASVGLSGIGADYADNMEVLGKADGRSWGGGVNLSVPLGQTSDDARYEQRLLEKQRRAIDLENLELQITQQARDRHRQVRINFQRTEAASAAVRLATQNVDDQEARLSLGMSTVREVLDAQDDLASARTSHLQAIVDYSKALILWTQLTEE